MQDTIGKLWTQTCIATSFQYDIVCVHTLTTRKLQVIYGRSAYWTTALPLVISILCVRGGCEIQLSSLWLWTCIAVSLPDKPFVHTYTHNLKTASHMDVLHIERPLLCQRHSCVVYSCMRDPTGELWGGRLASVALCWYGFACTYITVWCTTTHDNKSHVYTVYLRTAYCTNNGFTANVRANLASYITGCSVLSSSHVH